MTWPTILFTIYIVVGGYNIYSLWFGRSKIPFNNKVSNKSQLIGITYACGLTDNIIVYLPLFQASIDVESRCIK